VNRLGDPVQARTKRFRKEAVLATLTAEQAKLVREGKNFGMLATLREDGTPHLTPVWVDWDGNNVVINTSYGRAKDLHLRRDPRCAILIVSSKNPYEWISVTGRAVEITEKGAAEHIDKLAMKYEGVAKYPYMMPGERRVKVTIRPDRIQIFEPGDALFAQAKARLKKRGMTY
jgi:PPOX class probable F420-dependent enzyme